MNNETERKRPAEESKPQMHNKPKPGRPGTGAAVSKNRVPMRCVHLIHVLGTVPSWEYELVQPFGRAIRQHLEDEDTHTLQQVSS